jgi:hypothetical protein
MRLWLHTNWLPAPDRPLAEDRWTPFVWLREALETCASIGEVESLLAGFPAPLRGRWAPVEWPW